VRKLEDEREELVDKRFTSIDPEIEIRRIASNKIMTNCIKLDYI
jgi:hypothetical protein